MEARVHTGTLDFAAQLTVPAALAFQTRIGSAAKAARLRALRDRWAEAVRGLDGLEILTPADPYSMLLMAIPLVFLYFLGIGLCKYLPSRRSPFEEQAS